jgi:acetylornithine deacetylase/succinyl-diaminopimelate desuccinylase-like protein
MEGIAAATDEAEIQRHAAVLEREPLHNAVLRTGASLTILDGGFRSNVIPSEGTATFNVRILPRRTSKRWCGRCSGWGASPR